MKTIWWLFLLSPMALWAFEPPEPENHFEVGVFTEIFLPNELPELSARFTAYGIRAGFPVGNDKIQLGFNYGEIADTTAAYVGELAYRLNVRTPFFSGFFAGGAFVLHYRGPTLSPTKVGPLVATGFGISATKIFDVLLEMKLLFADRPMAAFAGNLLFKL